MKTVNSKIPSWCNSYFKENEILQLESVINEIEKTTTGELVVVINRRCSELKLLPITLTLLIWIAVENSRLIDFVSGQFGHSLLWQLSFLTASLAIGFALGNLSIWYRWLSSAEELSARAWAAAELEFYRSKINNTKEATGILIFISLYEHQVVVLADKQISDKKPNDTWSGLIAKIQNGIRSQNLSAGISDGLLQSGKLLSELFPAKKQNENELSNAIVFRDL